MINKIICGDALVELKKMESESVDCCICSPPYFGLRCYQTIPQIWDDHTGCVHEWGEEKEKHLRGKSSNATVGNNLPDFEGYLTKRSEGQFCTRCNAWRGELGLEPTFQLYIQHLMQIFDEVKRVLKKSGTCFVNLGDSYSGSGGDHKPDGKNNSGFQGKLFRGTQRRYLSSIPAKSLCLIPQRFAIAMVDSGWICRNVINWIKPNCLSGGTNLYVRTQNGDSVMTLRDVARLNSKTVKLWNGSKWTQVLHFKKVKRKGNELEILLRSGERISCTPEHRFPTNAGLKNASDLIVSDILQSSNLPEPEYPTSPKYIPDSISRFIGLYLAEGSRGSDGTIQISGHTKELARYYELKKLTEEFGGSYNVYKNGNNQDIRISSSLLEAIIDLFISGHTAKDKGLSAICWQRSNIFLNHILNGYLEGDGHYDSKNDRWRLGFTRNYNLERDLRTLCARLGYFIRLSTNYAICNGKKYPCFKGEIRFHKSNYTSSKNLNEIIDIRKARCRNVYDLSVADEPHLFCLSSGILTHNCMPESAKDRFTDDYEQIFFFVKSKKYYFQQQFENSTWGNLCWSNKGSGPDTPYEENNPRKKWGTTIKEYESTGENLFLKRNRRTSWVISTEPSGEKHFATYPEDLIIPMIKAGCPVNGTVLDPFAGIGTTGIVSKKLNCNFIGIELSVKYFKIAERRINEFEMLTFEEKI